MFYKDLSLVRPNVFLIVLQSGRTRNFSGFWCCLALYLGRACSMVFSCIYAKDMESIAEISMLAIAILVLHLAHLCISGVLFDNQYFNMI